MCLQSGEDMYGHAGMLGAAAAVWEDLRNNHILSALLDLPTDEECKPHRDEGTDRQYDSRMSRSEKEHHLEWEAGISDHPADQHPSTSSGQDTADKCARGAKACHGGTCHDALDGDAAAADKQAQHVAQGAQHCRTLQDSGQMAYTVMLMPGSLHSSPDVQAAVFATNSCACVS